MPEPRTITAAAELIRTGKLTPVALLEQCFNRIDRHEPTVRAWSYLDREGAQLEALRLTSELDRGEYRGPLHGIPVGIKDIIDVFDMPTSCGSKRWATSYARRDANCVERLRRAGAVIVGKTVTTAYASFDPPPTRNPWKLDRTPGGSSSGSAAAVACGMCLGALATQTGGSITRPASYCGVASVKPMHGRVSVDGVLPLAPSLDHIGAMANCVRDLALLMEPLANSTGWGHSPTATTVLRAPFNGKTLTTLPAFFEDRAEPVVRAVFARIQQLTSGLGWSWQAASPPATWPDVLADQLTIMAVEAATYHRERLQRHPEDYPPRVRSLIEKGIKCPAPDYVRAMGNLNTIRHELDEAFSHSWQTVATPATTSPAPTADTTGDPAFNAPWSLTGLPTVSFPIDRTEDGLPLAIQLVGARWGEKELFEVAQRLETDIGFENRQLPI